MSEFRFKPASWVPKYDPEVLEKVRKIEREDMEYTNENGFSVKVVFDPTLHVVQDIFHRIYLSDVNNTPFTMICPNQWPHAYSAVANMLNLYNVSCRNVHAFAMDEWADEDGNVAPLTYGAGLGYSFREHFYNRIREDLRPPVDHWHVFTNENKADNVYSEMIEECGGGGADVVYSGLGWPGHTAFIDPGTEAFKADTLEEFCKIGSRYLETTPLTIAENSLFPMMGDSGDVWGVPPYAVSIGPRDIMNARYRFDMHGFVSPTGNSWQRMISRIALYGPITMECPSTINRLGEGTCYVHEAIAKPFSPWQYGQKDWEL